MHLISMEFMQPKICAYDFLKKITKYTLLIEEAPKLYLNFAIIFLSKYKKMYYYISFFMGFMRPKMCAYNFLKKDLNIQCLLKRHQNYI